MPPVTPLLMHPASLARACLLSLVALCQPAAAQTPASSGSPYLYRWSFEAGGLPESEYRDGVRGGDLTVGGGEMDGVPVFLRKGGVSEATSGVLDASRNRYGSPNGAQVNSFGSALRTGRSSGRFTLTMWIRPELAPEKQPQARLVNISPEADEQAAPGVLIALEGDSFSFRVNGSPHYKLETSETVVKTGEWVFLAFCYDGLSENVYYTNDMIGATGSHSNAAILAGAPDQPTRLISKVAISTGAPNYNVSPGAVPLDGLLVAIGSSNSRYDRSFVGWIDDVRIYNSLLSTAEMERVRLEALGK